MKKTYMAVLALALSGMLGCGALAEAPAAEDAAETAAQTETASGEENSFFDRIGEGVDLITEAILDGWDKAGSAMENGMDWLQEKIGEWNGSVEAYFETHQWDEEVAEAWETLKEGAAHQGEVAKEKVTEAYNTMKDWLVQSGDAVDQSVAEAVDGMAEAAGVAQAELSGWYRKMEAYMTEKAGLMTDAARDAWETVKQNAGEAGSVSREKLEEACKTLREWLYSTGAEEDSEAVEGLDLLTAV